MQVQSAYRYSRHAICRLAQRGVSAEAMRILLEHCAVLRGCKRW
jgi:hypothetical protein